MEKKSVQEKITAEGYATELSDLLEELGFTGQKKADVLDIARKLGNLSDLQIDNLRK